MNSRKPRLSKSLLMLSALSLVLLISEGSVLAAADAYPSKPIRFIVPLAPGSSVDIMGRLLATKLGERLGKPVVVENRAGAGGVLGAELASKAAPDGHTMLVIGAFYGTNPALFTKLPFEPLKDFTPVAKMGRGMMVLVVHPSVPANSVMELIALAKQKPGQLVWPASGVGSSQHMAGELFKMRAGIDVKIVQFSGGSANITNLLGGHSEATISSIALMLPHIKADKLRALAVVGKKRSSFLPDVPTMEEAGVSNYEVSGWWGLLAPAGTPAPIIERLSQEIQTILTTDELKKFFQTQGAEMDYLGSDEFRSFIAEDIDQWKQVVKEANIKIEQ
jgi:tripartite-type tricarboxylate transporter receptor subunit TctC